MKNIFKISLMAMTVVFASCNDEPVNYLDTDFYKAEEKMTLTSNVEKVELNEDNLKDEVLTFEWTPAREMSEDYIVSYVTKLDVKGNEFSACVRTLEDDGIFSKTYTTEEIQKLLVDRWGRPAGKEAVLQFRVIAKWDGGDRYVMPEVRTVEVKVKPFKPLVFEADKVFLSGSALTGTSKYNMTRTIEDSECWAAVLNLKPGKLSIPISYQEATSYICPENGSGEITDSVAMAVVMKNTPVEWDITKEGEYRVVVHMLNKTVTIYSPDKQLMPKVVKFYPNNNSTDFTEEEVVVTNLYLRGDPDWSGRDLQLKQSLADPQILVYQGNTLKDRCGFAVNKGGTQPSGKTYSVHNTYVFTAPDTAENPARATIGLGTWMPLQGGSGLERGYYYVFPSGTNFIVFDLRNMKIKIEKR